MKRKELNIIKALTTIFFQEGFDRTGKHGLEYWCVNEEGLKYHCKQCKIWEDDDITYSLNTTVINGRWYIRLFDTVYDVYGDAQGSATLLLIPVNTKRLCWEEMTKCVYLISEYLSNYNFGF